MAKTHHEVARLWAAQSVPSAKGSNLFFEGDTIYSYGYHWPLAKLVRLDDTGTCVALLNNVWYSPTTNRHCCEAGAAAHRAGMIVWPVEHDMFDGVRDTATLQAAVEESRHRAEEREREKRERRNRQARRRRETRIEGIRETLSCLGEFGGELVGRMSDSFAEKVWRCVDNYGDLTHWCRRRRCFSPRTSLVDRETAVFVSGILSNDPSVVNRPKLLDHALLLRDNLLA